MIGPQASPARWTRQPGKIDALHTADLYHSDNPWGLPVIGNAGGLRPNALWPYIARPSNASITRPNVPTRTIKRRVTGGVKLVAGNYQLTTLPTTGRPIVGG